MADYRSFDCSVIDLLCTEETNGLCFDGGDDDLFNPFDGQSYQTNEENGMGFDNGRSKLEPLIYLPCLSEERIGWLVEREKNFLPRDDYLQRLRRGDLVLSLRKEALDWMYKACAYHNFGELCLYLAVNYLDRFLSVYDLPVRPYEKGSKTWQIQLVAVACLLLAAKVEEVNIPSTVDIQAGEEKVLFEGNTVQRMELVVLDKLAWKTKAYTPCNYIDYFLRKMNDIEFPPSSLIARSVQIILSTIKGIDFLEFRPSEIAAAVAIYVSGEIHAMDIDETLSGFIGVEKEKVVKCLELIQDLTSNGGTNPTTIAANVGNASNSLSVPHSPIGVLDAACLSYKSDETTVGSYPNSSHTSPNNKRRKLDQNTTLGGDDS